MTVREPYLQERDALQKRLDAIVEAAMDAVARAVSASPPPLLRHTFYGASAIHPRHLATWFVFLSDADHEKAQASGLTARIDALTREELRTRGYPAEGIPDISVGFTTEETVQREAGGDYWLYFK